MELKIVYPHPPFRTKKKSQSLRVTPKGQLGSIGLTQVNMFIDIVEYQVTHNYVADILCYQLNEISRVLKVGVTVPLPSPSPPPVLETPL